MPPTDPRSEPTTDQTPEPGPGPGETPGLTDTLQKFNTRQLCEAFGSCPFSIAGFEREEQRLAVVAELERRSLPPPPPADAEAIRLAERLERFPYAEAEPIILKAAAMLRRMAALLCEHPADVQAYKDLANSGGIVNAP